MSRIGYDRYGAQGGDEGAIIAPDLGRAAPDHVVGVHVNAATVGFMPFPPLEESELAELSDGEQRRVSRIAEFLDAEFGYAQIQSTRPQTLAYGLTDSPVGQLAWIRDKFPSFTHAEVPEDAVDRDRMLTNVMLYWRSSHSAMVPRRSPIIRRSQRRWCGPLRRARDAGPRACARSRCG